MPPANLACWNHDNWELPGRPSHLASAEDMAVQVRHGLPPVGTVVDDQAVAGLFEAKFVCHFRGLEQQVAKHFMVLRRGLGHARHGFLGENQNVGGCLWMNVPNGQHEVIFKYNFRRDLPGGNSFKQGLAHWEIVGTDFTDLHELKAPVVAGFSIVSTGVRSNAQGWVSFFARKGRGEMLLDQ